MSARRMVTSDELQQRARDNRGAHIEFDDVEQVALLKVGSVTYAAAFDVREVTC